MSHGPDLLLWVDISADLPSLEDLMEIALGGILHDDVEIFLIRKELVEADDMRVAEFRQQLHLRTGLPGAMALCDGGITRIEVTWIFFMAMISLVRLCCTL